jgi:hypothetical protein
VAGRQAENFVVNGRYAQISVQDAIWYYHGALVAMLRTLFGKRWSSAMWDLDAEPHNGMPYVQTGLKIVM